MTTLTPAIEACRESTVPTVFRGVFWDAHWEFDAPCVLYAPFKRFGIGHNSYHIDEMVEDICIDISLGKSPRTKWIESDLKEFKWRGWSPRGFAKRKEAFHVTITGRWTFTDDEQWDFEITDRKETWGPHE